jgi:hypothetical protein
LPLLKHLVIHLRDPGGKERAAWIADVQSRGLGLQIAALKTTNAAHAHGVEQRQITAHCAQGHALTNGRPPQPRVRIPSDEAWTDDEWLWWRGLGILALLGVPPEDTARSRSPLTQGSVLWVRLDGQEIIARTKKVVDALLARGMAPEAHK